MLMRNGAVPLLVGVLLLQGCGRREVELGQPPSKIASGQPYNDAGLFLAGLPGRPDGPYRSLERTPEWQKYSSEVGVTWERAEKEQFAPVDAFQIRELAPLDSKASFIFYPFSGPDVLYMNHFFPDGRLFVMAGLEPVGEIRTPQGYGKDLQRELRGWKRALSSMFNRSFFVTREMDTQFRGRVANGLLPVIVLLLVRSGHSLDSVRYGYLDEGGKFVSEEHTPGAKHKAVEIEFHRDAETSTRKLYYFSTSLSDEFKTNPAFSRYLRSLGTPNTLIKSASFLLHWKMCEALREQILATSDLILEDDTGVPYRYFSPPMWQVWLFGEYSRPDPPFRREYQPDMAAMFNDRDKVRPLGFSLGYGAGRRPSSLIIAKRTAR